MKETTLDTGVLNLPKIISDADALKIKCEPATKEEGEEIAKVLFQVLTETKGAGLAAPQIGINKRVFVVNVKKPLYFINPVITEAEGELIYIESCLSFSNVFVRTKRSSSFILTADNLDGKSYYDVSHIPTQFHLEDPDVFEMACIQHEYDHLDGVLMFDREYKPQPFHVEKTFGRNELVKVTDGKDTFTIKFKKAENNIRSKKWFLVTEGK